ncbi:hypothetical protein Nepgr_022811 [Nepenthes gracilis]|uniref:Uncharacterized protein n=1 Tax=Nepenthes gracilis TaxID=150966 RepID=A0AAD3XYF9_NEPGR|nr:hypothetical protein Nepgr_022811 [Nepenthes gracilis]
MKQRQLHHAHFPTPSKSATSSHPCQPKEKTHSSSSRENLKSRSATQWEHQAERRPNCLIDSSELETTKLSQQLSIQTGKKKTTQSSTKGTNTPNETSNHSGTSTSICGHSEGTKEQKPQYISNPPQPATSATLNQSKKAKKERDPSFTSHQTANNCILHPGDNQRSSSAKTTSNSSQNKSDHHQQQKASKISPIKPTPAEISKNQQKRVKVQTRQPRTTVQAHHQSRPDHSNIHPAHSASHEQQQQDGISDPFMSNPISSRTYVHIQPCHDQQFTASRQQHIQRLKDFNATKAEKHIISTLFEGQEVQQHPKTERIGM